jgi:DNA-binding response OmpR family regulator
LEHRRLRKAGKEVHLSPKEFELLALLMKHQNNPRQSREDSANDLGAGVRRRTRVFEILRQNSSQED